MAIHIRLETQNDFRKIEELTREAFWGFTRSTCDEHYLVHLLRQAAAFIPELDFVAEVDGRLAGNVMYSKAKVVDDKGKENEVITFGPLSVLPEYWHSGVGTALMKHSILKARDLGYRGILFHGHPDYYPRFGFQNAGVFGITNADGYNYDALMAMELYDNALKSIHGRFFEDPLFEIRPEDAEKYDREHFTKKEAVKLVPISVLLERLPEEAQKAITAVGDITTLPWLNRFSGREMLTWEGMNEDCLRTVNEVLTEYGYSKKLFPGCEILERAKKGIKALAYV